jgi:hypothetical protein
MSSIVLRAMGKTITKAVSIAEILKKRFPLHQVTEIGSTEIEEIYQPSVEGLDEYAVIPPFVFGMLSLFVLRSRAESLGSSTPSASRPSRSLCRRRHWIRLRWAIRHRLPRPSMARCRTGRVPSSKAEVCLCASSRVFVSFIPSDLALLFGCSCEI